MLQRLEGIDALLTPTTPVPAIPVESVDENDLSLSRYTRMVNYLGLCAISLPSGLSDEGLPTAIQFIARPDCEALLLQVARAVERLTDPLPLPDMTNFIAQCR